MYRILVSLLTLILLLATVSMEAGAKTTSEALAYEGVEIILDRTFYAYTYGVCVETKPGSAEICLLELGRALYDDWGKGMMAYGVRYGKNQITVEKQFLDKFPTNLKPDKNGLFFDKQGYLVAPGLKYFKLQARKDKILDAIKSFDSIEDSQAKIAYAKLRAMEAFASDMNGRSNAEMAQIALESKNDLVVEGLLDGLLEIKNPHDVDFDAKSLIRRGLASKDPYFRAVATRCITCMHDPDLNKRLLNLVYDKSPVVRFHALTALTRQQQAGNLPLLIKMKNDPIPIVQDLCDFCIPYLKKGINIK